MTSYELWIIQTENNFYKNNKDKIHSQKWFKEQSKYLGDDYVQVSPYQGLGKQVIFYHKRCGNYWSPRASGVVYGHYKCSYCFRNKGRQRFIKFCKSHKFSVLSDYQGAKKPVKIKAKCGHTFKREPTNLYHNLKCPYCNGLHQEGKISKLGKELKSWRKSKSFTQADVANLFKMSSHSISDLERGYIKPTKLQTQRITYYMNKLDQR